MKFVTEPLTGEIVHIFGWRKWTIIETSGRHQGSPLLSSSGKVKRDGGEGKGDGNERERERKRERGGGYGRVKEFAQRLAGNYGVIM